MYSKEKMSLIDNIYNRSPIFIQNAMISAYGYKLKRMRYGGTFSTNYAAAKKIYHYNKQQLHELQNKYLSEITRAAARYTPYYIDTIRINDAEIDNITGETLAEYFPVLEKNIIKSNQDAFYNRSINKSELHYINTSGTTGTPLKIAVTNEAIQKNYAYFARLLAIAGVSRHERSATFAGRVFIPARQNQPPYWRYNLPNNNLLLSSYRISDETIPHYLRALEKWQPKFIDSYPSAIYVVAKHIINNNIKHSIKPSVIITSSETLMDEHRKTIESAFGCKVNDHYGCAEMAAFITQCSAGNYHINADYGLVEILNDNQQPAKAGEIGEIVCTGFINHAMPLIRYRIGDSAILSDKSCDCGSKFQVVHSIEGRTDDLITTRDGRKIGRLDPIFKGLTGIKETQIIQTKIDHITLAVVRDDTYTDESLNYLISELKRRVGDDFTIKTEYRDSIEKTKTGKFRSVISLVY